MLIFAGGYHYLQNRSAFIESPIEADLVVEINEIEIPEFNRPTTPTGSEVSNLEQAPKWTPNGNPLAEDDYPASDEVIDHRVKVINDWYSTVGYFPPEDLAIYRSYNLETLLLMARDGDLMALQAIGLDMFFADENKELARVALLDAAARGSIYALVTFSSLSKSMYRDYLDGSVSEDQIQQWTQVPDTAPAELRIKSAVIGGYIAGGILGMHREAMRNLQRLESTFNAPMTPDDWRIGYEYAKFLLQRVEAHRGELFLDPFNRSYPQEYADTHQLPSKNNFEEYVREQIQPVGAQLAKEKDSH